MIRYQEAQLPQRDRAMRYISVEIMSIVAQLYQKIAFYKLAISV